MTRHLYLVLYDVSDAKRLHKARVAVVPFAVSAQKSFFECWMTPSEVTALTAELGALIDPATDRVHLLQLDPRRLHGLVGRGRRQNPEPFLMI